ATATEELSSTSLMTQAITVRVVSACVLFFGACVANGYAQRAIQPSVIIKSQHQRLTFAQDIQRIAVGDTEILSADLITSREVLVLGRETGRTTVIIWFNGGGSREYLFSVQRDLSVLERTLKTVHPSIEVDTAPDRDAIILTGTVPNVTVSETAEAVARNYLDASNNRRS